MDLEDIRKASLAYTPAIMMGRIISPASLGFLSRASLFPLILLVTTSATLLLAGHLLPERLTGFEHIVYGISGVVLALWSTLFALYCFSNYFRFRDIALNKKERAKAGIKVSFETAEILHNTDQSDLVAGFLRSGFGKLTLFRCGIPQEKIDSFISKRKNPLPASSLPTINREFVSVHSYVEALYQADEEFSDFIFKSGLHEKEFLGATRWIKDLFVRIRRSERWWSEENVSKIEPIGTDWAYGVAYELEKFSKPIEKMIDITDSLEGFHGKEIKDLELILSRTEEANALLISDAGTGKLAVIGGLASRIRTEKTAEKLAHKKVLVLDTGALMAVMKTRSDLEGELIKIMNQTTNAGNIIMVIDNLPYLIKGAQSLEADIVNLLDSYMGSSSVNIIALSDKANFHNMLEPDTTLMSRFEYVILEDIKEELIVSLLEEKLLRVEKENGITFTYPAILSIVSSARRYFPGGVMPDKAMDLLIEVAPYAVSKKIKMVEKEDVETLVRKKTGIPVGVVTEEEKGVLSNLEEILHEKIVGQDQAIDVISNALRRARSGISDPNRPLGSFLFLGPTGVGKTETSKALAEVFFESSENISRLDMSEYQGTEALGQLIGSLKTGRSGRLATLLREKPYSVLLLDEFEKADKDVHNLFLQTLDEGVFTDSAGKEVNARNSIIIATSNAGSDIIWEYSGKNENLREKTGDIIDRIIEKGIFSPELLNRFDGVIVFHPLDRDHLREIAHLEIAKLKKRIRERGIEVKISDEVVDHLIESGTDPKFGARALNRAVQEKLEKVIADRIIAENPKPGSVMNIGFKQII